MKTVILCGGKGMRLHEETENRPKPLVPVGGRPILSHIMHIYAQAGFRDFVLCLGYRGDVIKDFFLKYEAMSNDFTIRLGRQHSIDYNSSHEEQDYQVTLADTGLDTMTGGRIKKVQKYVDGDDFMVTYGDGLADIDINALLAFHRSHGRVATVTAIHPSSRYGVLAVGPDGAVADFSEKPVMNDWTSAGFFVFQRRFFDYLEGDDCFMELATIPRLAREGQLMAYKHRGFFFSMDTYRDYKYLNDMYDRGQTPWVRK